MSSLKFDDYPFVVRPLSRAEGGGWFITWPDLPGCMSDGATPEETVENGKDASAESVEVATGIVLDYDAAGNLVGIDIDNASRKVALKELTLSKLPAVVLTSEV